ncbi:hypothetical protein Tco_0960087, partial [Tanacetum coccineum]
DKAATNLLWNSRWGIALDIGEAIRYLHEDFVDGSIVNLSLCSSNVGLARASSDMSKNENINMSEHFRTDVKDYGVLLLELISGQSNAISGEQFAKPIDGSKVNRDK